MKGIKKLALLAAFVAGIASINLIAPAPQADAAACTAYTYRNGSRATCVRYIQTMLNTCAKHIGNCCYNVYPNGSQIAVDGAYGRITTERVRVFQKYHGLGRLAVDGIVGPETWAQLCDSMRFGAQSWIYNSYYSWRQGVNAARAAGCAI